jgi:hypothetical protein
VHYLNLPDFRLRCQTAKVSLFCRFYSKALSGRKAVRKGEIATSAAQKTAENGQKKWTIAGPFWCMRTGFPVRFCPHQTL